MLPPHSLRIFDTPIVGAYYLRCAHMLSALTLQKCTARRNIIAMMSARLLLFVLIVTLPVSSVVFHFETVFRWAFDDFTTTTAIISIPSTDCRLEPYSSAPVKSIHTTSATSPRYGKAPFGWNALNCCNLS